MSLPIPVDVIEEVIDNVHDLDDAKSLCKLALTSRSFLRRSRYCLFSYHIRLDNIKKVNSFCDFLDTHPDWRSWVKLITISSTEECPSMLEVVPVRLLTNLPNLEKWRIVTPYRIFFGGDPKHQRWISSNTPKLTCLRHYAQPITHLYLKHTSFQSCADFARYILAFPCLRVFHCECLRFQHEDDETALVRAKERLRKELQLSHLTIDDESEDVAVLLLVESAQDTLQELVIDVTSYFGDSRRELPTLILRLSKLSSISLRAWFRRSAGGTDDTIQKLVEILQALASSPNSLITHVTVHLRARNISGILEYLREHSDCLGQMCRTLETALLRLPRLQTVELCHLLRRPLRNWTPTRLEQLFPALYKRGLINMRCLAPLIQGHSSGVSALAMSPDSRWIASNSFDTTIILWDAQHGIMVHEWPAHPDTAISLAFSPDGRHLASLSEAQNVMVWDVSEGTEVKLVTTLEGAGVCIWSPDGTIHALGGRKGTVQVWNPTTNQAQIHSLEGYSEEARCLTATFSSDRRWTVAFDGSWKVWDFTTGRLHKDIAGSSWNSVAFDPAGRRIALPFDDHSTRIWDVETGDQLAVLEGRTQGPCNIVFSPDGTRVLSIGSDDKTIRLWDSFSGNVVLSFRGHERKVLRVCFSPDGKYVASTSNDQTVRLWNASDGSCIRTFTEHDDAAWDVAFSPDGETLVSGGDDGRVCMRRLRDVCPEEYPGDA